MNRFDISLVHVSCILSAAEQWQQTIGNDMYAIYMYILCICTVYVINPVVVAILLHWLLLFSIQPNQKRKEGRDRVREGKRSHSCLHDIFPFIFPLPQYSPIFHLYVYVTFSQHSLFDLCAMSLQTGNNTHCVCVYLCACALASTFNHPKKFHFYCYCHNIANQIPKFIIIIHYE